MHQTDNLFGGCLIDWENRTEDCFLLAPYGEKEKFFPKKTGYMSITQMVRKTNKKTNKITKLKKEIGSKSPGKKEQN